MLRTATNIEIYFATFKKEFNMFKYLNPRLQLIPPSSFRVMLRKTTRNEVYFTTFKKKFNSFTYANPKLQLIRQVDFE